MSLAVIGLSHHSSPLELRERFAIPSPLLPKAMNELQKQTNVDEILILSTCNRVELYIANSNVNSELISNIKQCFADHQNVTIEFDDAIYEHHGRQCIIHLFRVASGLDSMMLGETEILGQLKHAYHLALRHNHTGRLLNKTFQKAFRVAKQIRSETDIQRGATSIAAAGVDLAERIFDDLSKHRVMVLGAGDTSEKTARALLSRGIRSVIVSNRSHSKAVDLARELGGRAIYFEEWGREFSEIDIVISSTAAPHFLLNRSCLQTLLKDRLPRPLLLIDLAVPRDIDPSSGFLENVYLYNVDDLQAIADDHIGRRKKEIIRCQKIIESQADEALSKLIPPESKIKPNPKLKHEM